MSSRTAWTAGNGQGLTWTALFGSEVSALVNGEFRVVVGRYRQRHGARSIHGRVAGGDASRRRRSLPAPISRCG